MAAAESASGRPTVESSYRSRGRASRACLALKTFRSRGVSFLQEINDALTEDVRLVCMGGFVMTQLYGFSRPTVDIDALAIYPKTLASEIQDLAEKSGPLHSKYKIYLHSATIAAVPEDYDERLTEMYAGAFPHLHIFALDPYDL